MTIVITTESIKVLIVDDEPLARNYIRRLLGAEPDIKIIGECGNGKEAVGLIKSASPDLVFLDVQMPEMDGFSTLKNLDNRNLPLIIFTTAYEEYAVRAFEIHAIDYLLKPFDQVRFLQSLTYARERLSSSSEKEANSRQFTELLKNLEEKPPYLKRLLIKKDGRIVFLKTEEIDWIKADDKYINLFSANSSHLVRQTLNAIKTQLDPQVFVQISRSVIVNVERIRELQTMFSGEYVVVMTDATELAVSRNYKNELFDILGKPL